MLGYLEDIILQSNAPPPENGRLKVFANKSLPTVRLKPVGPDAPLLLSTRLTQPLNNQGLPLYNISAARSRSALNNDSSFLLLSMYCIYSLHIVNFSLMLSKHYCQGKNTHLYMGHLSCIHSFSLHPLKNKVYLTNQRSQGYNVFPLCTPREYYPNPNS